VPTLTFRTESSIFTWDGDPATQAAIQAAASDVSLVLLYGGFLRVSSPASQWGSFVYNPGTVMIVRGPNVLIGLSPSEFSYLFDYS
jgi:hypothetical protein